MLGAIIGIISGLIPGLHPNLFGKYLSIYSAISAIIFYRYFSHIREIFLMVPDESNVLSLHPMYKLYKRGLGFRALLLSNFGVLIASLIAFVLLPLIIWLTKELYEISREIGWALLIISIGILIYTEKNKLEGVLIILLSGTLGLFALKIENGIIPLLSGLFAIPMLVSKNTKKIKQKVEWKLKISKRGVLFGFLSSLFLVLTPAIGPTQSAIIAKSVTKDEDFLFTMGVINGFDIVFASIMFLLFGYSRSGALNQSFSTIAPSEIYPIIAFGVGLSFIGFILSNEVGAVISKLNFNIDKVKFVSLLFLIIISFIASNIYGVLIFIIAGSIGILANKLKVRMVNCMGSLMIPSLSKKFV